MRDVLSLFINAGTQRIVKSVWGLAKREDGNYIDKDGAIIAPSSQIVTHYRTYPIGDKARFPLPRTNELFDEYEKTVLVNRNNPHALAAVLRARDPEEAAEFIYTNEVSAANVVMWGNTKEITPPDQYKAFGLAASWLSLNEEQPTYVGICIDNLPESPFYTEKSDQINKDALTKFTKSVAKAGGTAVVATGWAKRLIVWQWYESKYPGFRELWTELIKEMHLDTPSSFQSGNLQHGSFVMHGTLVEEYQKFIKKAFDIMLDEHTKSYELVNRNSKYLADGLTPVQMSELTGKFFPTFHKLIGNFLPNLFIQHKNLLVTAI